MKEISIQDADKTMSKKSLKAADDEDERTLSEGEQEQVILPNIDALEREYDDLKQKALKSYSFAVHKAEKNLIASHPVRLGIALNFSVFQYEHQYVEYEANVKAVTKAIEGAQKKMDNIRNDQDREDSKTIVSLMRENLTQWADERDQMRGQM